MLPTGRCLQCCIVQPLLSESFPFFLKQPARCPFPSPPHTRDVRARALCNLFRDEAAAAPNVQDADALETVTTA